MRIGRRSDRRASWTRRVGAVLAVGVLAALSPALHPQPVSAASGVDDYPSRLKNAPQDSLVDPWQFYNRECTSFVAWRLNSENQVAFNDYWQGQHWGNASNWKQAAVALKIPVDNHASRGAVAWWAAGSAGLVARPRRVGADRRRRRDHDRGVQLPPRRHVRHPHHLELELVVAERLHPHQGHPGPQHRVSDGLRYAAGRQEADLHPRHVERQGPHLQLPVAGQRQADRRRDEATLHAQGRPAGQAPAGTGHRDQVRCPRGQCALRGHRHRRQGRLRELRAADGRGEAPGRRAAGGRPRHVESEGHVRLPVAGRRRRRSTAPRRPPSPRPPTSWVMA